MSADGRWTKRRSGNMDRPGWYRGSTPASVMTRHLARAICGQAGAMGLHWGWQVLAVCLIGLSLTSAAAAQTIWYVDAANCLGPGSGTHDDPFCNIQDAINAAAGDATPPDEILVADGIYTGDGNKNLDFGGKTIVLRSAGGPERCIIDCERDGRGFYFHSGETAASVVQGFTIRNGSVRANSPGSFNGGGVLCEGASPTLVRCTMVGNAANYGGALACIHANPMMTSCQIRGNTARNAGGGLHCDGASPVVTNCTVRANVASWGGGVYCHNGSCPTLTNCTIEGNAASDNAGGMYCANASPVLTNCILWGDTPQEVYPSGSGSDRVLTYSDVQGGFPGEGNIDVDPDFAFAGDSHLMPGSPCIDAGTNSPSGGLPPQDADGNPRSLDGNGDGEARADMGAYEFNPEVPAIALTPTRIEFYIPEGQVGEASQHLSIRNAGGGTLHWQLGWEASWLQADRMQGESAGEVNTVTLAADATALVHGTYSTLLTVADSLASNNPRIVEVVLYATRSLHVPSGYATIQAAIDAALVSGDEVVLADGTYTGTGNKDLDFNGKAITVRSESVDPAACIIDCEGSGRGFYFHSEETAEAVVAGITIRNGFVSDNSPGGAKGGGIYSSDSAPTLTDCRILESKAASGGGAYFIGYSNPVLSRCEVSGNVSQSGFGGGVCSEDYSTVTLLACSINRNISMGSGGGVGGYYGALIFSGCSIRDNAAYGGSGGGVYCAGSSSVRMDNCTVIRNALFSSSSGDGGGGLDASYYSDAIVTNCTFSGNHVAPGCRGGAVHLVDFATWTLTNCVLWDNTPEEIYTGSGTLTVTYSDVRGGWAGTGNIQVNPGFAFPDDCHLMPGSPCIDAGTDSPSHGLPPRDADGNPRSLDGNLDGSARVDMGAYEFTPDHPTIALSSRRFVFSAPEGQGGQDLKTLSIRNSGTGTLRWTLGFGDLWLQVTPSQGDSSGEVGEVTLTTDAASLSHGTYAARLEVDDPHSSNSPQAVEVVLDVTRSLRVPSEFTTIQAAIDAAVTGDEVVVADGVYSGAGNKDLDFGGKAITVRSESGLPTGCIIDCENSGRGFYFHSGEAADAALIGFTVRSGLVDEYSLGGAKGGGICCHYASPQISNCIISDNVAKTSPWSSTAYGGGVSCESSSAVLRNCVIVRNTAYLFGGGVLVSGYPAAMLVNCTISGNRAFSSGGGVYAAVRGEVKLTNCILWNDVPQELDTSSWRPVVTFSDVQGGWDGTGNIDADPGFAFGDDFHLVLGSQCIDRGTEAPDGGLFLQDVDGNPRMLDGDGDGQAMVDMGAYEFNPTAALLAVSPTRIVFAVPAGQTGLQPKTLLIRNVGGGTLHWQLAWGVPWLTASPTGGDATDQVASVLLTADASGLPHGAYTTTLVISDQEDPGTPRVVEVVLNATAVMHVPGQFATIQTAIDATVPGDEVLIADGLYVGAGNKDLDFHGKAITVRSAGGDPFNCVIDCEGAGRGFYFHSYETADARVEGLTIRNAATRGVACDSSSATLTRCILINNAGAVYGSFSDLRLSQCQLCDNAHSGITSYYGCVNLSECNITGNGGNGLICQYSTVSCDNCAIDHNTSSEGAGVHGFYANLSLTNCSVSENSVLVPGSTVEGGGIHCEYGVATLTNCTICNNTIASNSDSFYGGGIFCSRAELTLISCAISGNTIDGSSYSDSSAGGGVYCQGSCTFTDCSVIGNRVLVSPSAGGGLWVSGQGTIDRCAITDNEATYGGGVYCSHTGHESSPSLSNCVIARNAASYGAGFYCTQTARPSLSNCTISSNRARVSGGGVYGASPYYSTPTLIDCILWGDSPQEVFSTGSPRPVLTYCDVQGGYAGMGNINADPLFMNPLCGNYRLSSMSPCIDAGSREGIPPEGGTDIDGIPRILDGDGDGIAIVDMGAHEYETTPMLGDINGDGMVDGRDIQDFVAAYILAGGSGTGGCIACDIINDGVLNAADMTAFIACMLESQRT
jgi:pectin methylesterase-like acyl-CoA thioesterase